MNKVINLVIIFALSICLFTGCSKEKYNDDIISDTMEENVTEPPTELPTEPPTEPPLVHPETGELVSDYIFSLSNATRSAGYRAEGPRDETNRPYAVLNLQNEYGAGYNTVFIGENEKVIYLTFVEGTEYVDADGVRKTEKLLNILKDNDVKATFFCTGSYVRNSADLCRRMIEEGHSLGGHGYAHVSGGMALQSVSAQYNDAYQMKNLVREVLGIELKLYKPDYEKFSHQSLAILNDMGLKTMMQSFAYRDYLLEEHPDNNETLDMFKKTLHNGEIMCLHPLCDTNIEIMQDFITYAKEQGYIFKSMN